DFRRSARATAVKSAALAGVALTVGLFSGLLPASAGLLMAAYGCTRGVYEAAKESLEGLSEKPARANDYYFLWKARTLIPRPPGEVRPKLDYSNFVATEARIKRNTRSLQSSAEPEAKAKRKSDGAKIKSNADTKLKNRV